MNEIAMYRRFFADEVAAVANLKSPALVEALAAVPRERFLAPGPWLVRAEADTAGARPTPDADPRRVYHNYAIAIDPARQLFNGAPALVAGTIDLLRLQPGERVLHVGAGLGYYSAILAHIVGASGRVEAFEVDDALALQAAKNLSETPWVRVHYGDASKVEGSFDAVLVNAGVTHPPESWLRALAPHGRIILPLTASIPAMGPISKGVMTMLARGHNEELSARVLTFVAIYSAVGLRDETMNERLGKALMRTPFPRIARVRRDAHDSLPACWLHGDGLCLSLE
jgi:protein-L-isoaspartate(D-aspartate) O-methyltransferase